MSKKEESLVQQTLVVFKPDTVQRGIVGEILSRFERVGLKIVATKMVNPDRDHYFKHYEDIGQMATRRGEKVLDQNLQYMSSGPVIAVVLEGVEAVAIVRKIVGATEPKAADMGTVRGDYSHISFGYADKSHKATPNLIHASASLEDAEKEISHWFGASEIMDYQLPLEKYTR